VKKLLLNPDALRVESFATERAGQAGGTVRGHEGSYAYDCPYTWDTCGYGCGDTFDGTTCVATCKAQGCGGDADTGWTSPCVCDPSPETEVTCDVYRC
jgi:hypothetical protein